MNFFQKITYPIWKGTFEKIERSIDLSNHDPYLAARLFGGDSKINLTETTAQKLSAVYTCLKIYCESYAQLPKHVYQRDEQGKRIKSDSHPVYKAINVSANKYMNSYDFWYTIIYFKYAWGNGIAKIIRERGVATEFHLLEPWNCRPFMSDDGELFIIHKGDVIPYEDVLHLKNHPKNGYWGRSILTENRETFKSALKQEEYGQNALGEKPPAILSTDKALTTPQYKEVKEWWESQSKDEIGKTKVLGAGFKFSPTMIPPGDAQYLESKNFTIGQIYSIFRIPPTFAQNYERATYKNSEQQDLVFIKHSLMPGIIQAEQEINMKCFAPSNYLAKSPYKSKMNVKGLLRGDTAAQALLINTMISKGVFSPNMALQLLDMDPFEGGDRRIIQSGFIPFDRMDDFIDKTGSSPHNQPVEDDDKVLEKLLRGIKINGEY